MHPRLTILGYSEAAMFIRQTPPTEISGIISIHGSREFAVECNCIHRLDLVFDDTESPTTNDVASLQRELRQRRWNEQNNRIENAPSLSDAAAIIEFAKKVQNASGTIVCHCGAGMSRAPAAALICMAVWNGPGTESGCVDSIRQLRHGTVPHIGLVGFADKLLSRNGKLIAALK